MHSNPNPQGKGLVTVFDSLDQSQASIAVPPKQVEQVSNELFTSLFVLHSRFQFKPVVGKSYWLYRRGDQFQLSLISPTEWGDQGFGQYIGECVMQPDITWSLTMCEQAQLDVKLLSYIETRRQQFDHAMESSRTMATALPFYVDGLPFYQRVFASALACSLRDSMQKSKILGLPYSEARQLALDAADR